MTMRRSHPGLGPFQRADSEQFFGRRREAAALADLWRANTLTIAAGPPGSGKTSLVQAGVLPLVEQGRAQVLPPGRVSYGATYPFAGLPEHNPYTVALLRSWSPDETMSQLIDQTVHEYLQRRTEDHGGPVLAVIDQAEELLADAGPRKRRGRQFLAELATAIRSNPRLHLLLCTRESRLNEFRHALGGGVPFHVGPLTFDAAVDAVTGQAEAAGLRADPGAVAELVMEVQTSTISVAGGERSTIDEYVQPTILQVACRRFWDALPENLQLITQREVRRYGDVGTFLSVHCSRVAAAVAEEFDVPIARLRSWLTQTFITDTGHRGTTYEGMTHTAGMPNAVVRTLEDRHLLTSEWRSGSRWYELLSDRLIAPLLNGSDEHPDPGAPAEYLQSAARMLAFGDLDLAERYAAEALRLCLPRDLRQQAEVQSLLGNLAYEGERFTDAEARYRQAAGLFETIRDTAAVARQLAAVGQTLRDQERPADAVVEFRAAVDRLPNDALIQTALGWALRDLGQPRAAGAVFTGVLAVDGGNTEALRGRGEVFADLGDARGALRDLDRLPLSDQPAARAARGLALAQLGDQAKANEEIQAAITEAPRNGPVLLYAARAEALSGDRPTSIELAERAVNAAAPPLPPHQREAAQELANRTEEDGQDPTPAPASPESG